MLAAGILEAEGRVRDRLGLRGRSRIGRCAADSQRLRRIGGSGERVTEGVVPVASRARAGRVVKQQSCVSWLRTRPHGTGWERADHRVGPVLCLCGKSRGYGTGIRSATTAESPTLNPRRSLRSCPLRGEHQRRQPGRLGTRPTATTQGALDLERRWARSTRRSLESQECQRACYRPGPRRDTQRHFLKG
jgi:hypothetical protein